MKGKETQWVERQKRQYNALKTCYRKQYKQSILFIFDQKHQPKVVCVSELSLKYTKNNHTAAIFIINNRSFKIMIWIFIYLCEFSFLSLSLVLNWLWNMCLNIWIWCKVRIKAMSVNNKYYVKKRKKKNIFSSLFIRKLIRKITGEYMYVWKAAVFLFWFDW